MPLQVPTGLALQEAVKNNCATNPQALNLFVQQALEQENIQTWLIDPKAEVVGEVAIVSAPWFWESRDPRIARHVAVAIAKVDYYTFK